MESEKISVKNPQKEKIKKAAAILKRGGVVAFPTDTVYGIGIDATNKKAFLGIYQIKKRDKNKPLIILIGIKRDTKKYSHSLNGRFFISEILLAFLFTNTNIYDKK